MSVSDRPTPDGDPNDAHTDARDAHGTHEDAHTDPNDAHTDARDAHGTHEDAQYIEIWNDLVSTRDLTWSIAICGGTTAAALGIATTLHSDEFFWGLGGAVLGFVIAALVFTPKRIVTVARDAVARDAVARDAVARDAVARDAVGGEDA